jgi:hypothetical protein
MDIVAASIVERFEEALEWMESWTASAAVRGFRRELRVQVLLHARDTSDATARAHRLIARCAASPSIEVGEVREVLALRVDAAAGSPAAQRQLEELAEAHALESSVWRNVRVAILAYGQALCATFPAPALVAVAAHAEPAAAAAAAGPLSVEELRSAWARRGGSQAGWMALYRGDAPELESFIAARST